MVQNSSKQDWYTYLAEKKAQGLRRVCENRKRNSRSLRTHDKNADIPRSSMAQIG
jgi:hypothetical protein